MAKECFMTGKRRTSGNKRSHSNIATKRTWGANLQKKTIMVDGKLKRVYLSTRAIKTLNKQNNA